MILSPYHVIRQLATLPEREALAAVKGHNVAYWQAGAEWCIGVEVLNNDGSTYFEVISTGKLATRPAANDWQMEWPAGRSAVELAEPAPAPAPEVIEPEVITPTNSPLVEPINPIVNNQLYIINCVLLIIDYALLIFLFSFLIINFEGCPRPCIRAPPTRYPVTTGTSYHQ